MKKNYTLKTLTIFTLVILLNLTIEAQVRITKVDPSTNIVTLKNFGSSSQTISNLWFCNFPSYGQVSGMTSTTSLNAGQEVVITSTVNFGVADGEFGLYTSTSFGSSAAMIDYLQWGSSGHQRESVAVGAGVWGVGTFLTVPAPFEFTGTTGNEIGVGNWRTVLSLESFEEENAIELFPNPTANELNIQFLSNQLNSKVLVFDITGKTVINQKLNNVLNTIDVSSLFSGLYIIKVESDKGSQLKKFIKE